MSWRFLDPWDIDPLHLTAARPSPGRSHPRTESEPPDPDNRRLRTRTEAEAAWLDLVAELTRRSGR